MEESNSYEMTMIDQNLANLKRFKVMAKRDVPKKVNKESFQ